MYFLNISAIVAAVHLLALGIGMGSCLARGHALKSTKDIDGLKAVFFNDNLFGMAALLWIATGLWRAFGGLEKGTQYYVHSHAFWIKMGLFVLVFLLEIKPMATLIGWRIQLRKKLTPDISSASKLGTITFIEAGILPVIVFVAVGMARGYWF